MVQTPEQQQQQQQLMQKQRSLNKFEQDLKEYK